MLDAYWRSFPAWKWLLCKNTLCRSCDSQSRVALYRLTSPAVMLSITPF